MSTTKYLRTLMSKRSLGAAMGLLLVLSLSATAVFADTTPPATTGQGGIVVKNYWGNQMDFNIGDTEYFVPANGQLFIALPAGDYTFSANVEGEDSSARTGEILLTTGQRLDLGFAAAVPLYVMSVEASSATPKTPPAQTTTQTTTGTTTTPVTPAATGTTQASKTGVLVKNFWGQDLTFTINGSAYDVAAGGQMFLPLAAGDYTDSANANGGDDSNANGDVMVVDGHTVVLNSYLNSPYTPFLQ